MNRVVKFRGKRVSDGSWVFGYYFTNGLENHKHLAKHYIISKISGHIGAKDITIVYHEVIPETIGQFTGLVDKNGVEIYEGDVMSFTAFGNRYNVVVEYVTGMFKAICKEHKNINPLYLDEAIKQWYAEVIGNIYTLEETK